jgi:hypothetical protein
VGSFAADKLTHPQAFIFLAASPEQRSYPIVIKRYHGLTHKTQNKLGDKAA